MGNGKSQPAGLLIEDKAFIANNFWTLHNAVYGNETERNVTVFAGVADTKGEFSALEMFSKVRIIIFDLSCCKLLIHSKG